MPLKLNHMLAKLNYYTLTTSNLLKSSDCHTEEHATVKELPSLSFCSVLTLRRLMSYIYIYIWSTHS